VDGAAGAATGATGGAAGAATGGAAGVTTGGAAGASTAGAATRSTASGGGSSAGGCSPPPSMQVDWVFGSTGVAFTGYAVTGTGQASDHSMVHTTATLTGDDGETAVLPDTDIDAEQRATASRR
jgi:hypothetical protein